MVEKDENTPKPAEVNPDEFAGLTDDERRKRGRAPDPMLPGESAPKAKPPLEVHAAFVLAIVGAVIVVVGQVVTFAFKQQLVDAMMKQPQKPGHPLTLEEAQSTANFFVWSLLIGAVCFASLLVLFAWKAREGTRSARSIATLLAVLGIVFELGVTRSIFALAASLALVVMLILLYLPKVADYFPKVGKTL
ncbi:hypothetical protein ATK30_3090 [Amycolatopsis echigonensis]|uniref:Uncharacterized protein n=1 Tax=Amycolatopsis echigonensis TaxID=2576905 RepID=A0A2N3WEH0_9PSEU|nr:hypothetical protein [Amycolatopsis niigatensis]PKV92294.1 hypothetical protein ATK30_3090 [Amycolatopsis niigatensis]